MAPEEPVPDTGEARVVRFQIDAGLQQERVDRALSRLDPSLSRAAAASLIAEGHVTVNDRPVKASTRLVAGAVLRVNLPPPKPVTAQPEDIPLSIVYEDSYLVVVDKPAGMVVHPAPGNEHGTLVNALLGRYASLPGDPLRPGIVHRLDKGTSGLMVVALAPEAVAALAGLFKRREIHKEYMALVIGALTPPSGSISGNIGRDPRHRQRMAVLATGGREARTTYQTEEALQGFSLLRVVLETGRMHQIRVHLSAVGHPIVGDPLYGRPVRGLAISRQFLHATRLRFRHPRTDAVLDLVSPLPPDLAGQLDALRR
jgi:23S rRNA pseudouridine1911/1915/1917 synthase